MTGTWYGLLLGSQRRSATTSEAYPAVRAEAGAAVQLGITRLVAPEHLHSEPYLMLRPWPLLAALRAEIAPFEAVGSVIAGLSSTAQLFGDLTTVSAIGAGSVGVALTAGYRQDDFVAARQPYQDRFRLRAQLRLELAGSGSVSAGMLWSAASTVRAASRAKADGAVWYGGPTMSDKAAAEIGEGGVVRRDVLIGVSDADVGRRWDQYIAPKYAAYARWGYTDDVGQVLAGTAEQVVDRLGSLIDVAHPSGIVLRLCWPDMDGPSALDHVLTFGDEVLPVLRQEPLPMPAGRN